ncbi:MAG: hypothetical protein K0R50_1578 [Eubacterium sp.]|nr:hypothetical protein [Eubacterium sp.]
MSVFTIELSYTEEGHVLAEDVYSNQGAVIVKAYTTLNKYIINRIREFKVTTIKIFEPQTGFQHKYILKEIRKAYEDKILEAKEIVSEIITTEAFDAKKITKLSERIYSDIEDNEYLVSCMNVLRCSDEYTYYHSLNVAYYSALIGKWLKLPQNRVVNVIKSGLLHDIGKIRVPNDIINKKGKLLPEEFEEIKKHTLYGFDMIEKAESLDNEVKNAVLMHHEREDGSGYPLGYSGSKIDFCAKIVAIADVYDAMTSKRVYGKKSTPFEAFEMFLTEGFRLFDTNMADVFIKGIAPFYVGAKVLLDTGELAEIVYIPYHSLTRPTIRHEGRYIDLNLDYRYNITACYF